MPDLGYAFDGLTPVRWLVSEIVKGGESPPSLSELSSRYRHNHGTGDLSRVMLHEALTENDANAFILRRALVDLGDQVMVREDGTVVLTKPLDEIRYNRRRVYLIPEEPSAPWSGGRDPFNPGSGIFADNIRLQITLARDNMNELRESMRAFGWVEEFPALVDERDIVLVGNRRMAVAKELGIEPVIKKLTIGRGDEADAYRLKLALASNIGSKPFSPDERKRIAEYLYGEREWTMERIKEALGVGLATVSRDLQGFSTVEKPNRPKGGRPRKPKPSPEVKEAALLHLDGGVNVTAAARSKKVPRLAVRTEIVAEEARREVVTPTGQAVSVCLHKWPVPSNVEALIDTMESTWPELEFLLTGRSPELAERFGRQWSRAIEDLKLEVSE